MISLAGDDVAGILVVKTGFASEPGVLCEVHELNKIKINTNTKKGTACICFILRSCIPFIKDTFCCLAEYHESGSETPLCGMTFENTPLKRTDWKLPAFSSPPGLS
jgi:hypothetical protein